MNALAARLAGWLRFGSRVRHDVKPLSDSEPTDVVSRPMTGFMATLTPDQKARALAYRGPEDHGNPELALKR